jgi:NitT/TauT family transport system substrate-binding protein
MSVSKPAPSRGMWLAVFVWLLATLPAGSAQADPVTIKVAALRYGTAAWEIEVARRHGLDRANGLAVETVELAGKDATMLALRTGQVDLTLQDWPFVSQQRARGEDLLIIPHRGPVGGLVQRKGQGIVKVGDLKGKKIGVAGGPLDKSWVILRAFALASEGFDPAVAATPVFGAPPLLNELLKKGELDLALQYWNFNARLDPDAFEVSLPVSDMLALLDARGATPINGWATRGEWSKTNQASLAAFMAMIRSAQKILLDSDAEWTLLAPQLRAEDDRERLALRDAYRAGVSAESDRVDPAAVDKLLAAIARIPKAEASARAGEIFLQVPGL